MPTKMPRSSCASQRALAQPFNLVLRAISDQAAAGERLIADGAAVLPSSPILRVAVSLEGDQYEGLGAPAITTEQRAQNHRHHYLAIATVGVG